MPKHVLKWRPVPCKDVRGGDIEIAFADELEICYRGSLLAAVLAMPRLKPISFNDAACLAMDKQDEVFDDHKFGYEPGNYGWYSTHFIEWISSLGYHIELTGDEFELACRSRLAA